MSDALKIGAQFAAADIDSFASCLHAFVNTARRDGVVFGLPRWGMHEQDGRRVCAVEATVIGYRHAGDDVVFVIDRGDTPPFAIIARLVAGESPLAVLRAWRGRTQADLAAAARLSQPYLSNLEARNKVGSVGAYTRLAAALNVRVDLIQPAVTR